MRAILGICSGLRMQTIADRDAMLKGFLLCAALCTFATSSAFGQTYNIQVLAGYGGIGYEGRLNPAYHVNLRHRVIRLDSTHLPSVIRWLLPRMTKLDVSAEAFFQYGDGGRALDGCLDPLSGLCTRQASPFWLLGIGFVSRWDVTPEGWPVQFYFLPITAGFYIRSFDSRRPLTEDASPTEIRPGVGYGSGIGFRFATGNIDLILEARSILVYGGGYGGGLPFSIGIEF